MDTLKLGLSATKNVLDNILENKHYSDHIQFIDLRKMWIDQQANEYFSPDGGLEYPGRAFYGGQLTKKTSPGLLFKMVSDYHNAIPVK